jgi:hypothetical protein
VQVARSCYRTIRVSYGGNEQDFMEFLALVDKGQRQVVSVFAFRLKGHRESLRI